MAMSNTWPLSGFLGSSHRCGQPKAEPSDENLRTDGAMRPNFFVRRLSQAREAVRAKAIRPKAKVAPEADSPPHRSSGAKPPLIPGGGGSPQRRQQSFATPSGSMRPRSGSSTTSEDQRLGHVGARCCSRCVVYPPCVDSCIEPPYSNSYWDYRACSCSTASTPRASPSPEPASSRSPAPSTIPEGDAFAPREVFILYASPLDHPAINVRSEVEIIREALADSGAAVRLNVGVATASSLTKLLTLARARRGLVLHLSAHAVVNEKGDLGLVLEDARGASHILWRQQLEEILGVRERGLRTVSFLFLSTCWSEPLAQVFVECGCQHVIALRTKVHDSAARRFSQQLYLSLGVGMSLLNSWDNARRVLRIESDKEIADQADHFVLFGQRRADEVSLDDLCGVDSRRIDRDGMLRELEDASVFLDMKVPPRPEHFLGRTQTVFEVLHAFGGISGRRACAITGPEGIGKSALGVEIAHFASSPGRLFSCSARVLKIETSEAAGILSTLLEEMECLASQLRVSLRPQTGESRRSSVSSWPPSWHSSPSMRSDFSSSSVVDVVPSSDMVGPARSDDALLALLPVRQLLRKGFQQIEQSRRGIRMLLVVDDEVGALGSSPDVRRLFGELLEHTYQLQVLICSRSPIYQSLGTTKVVNIQLKGLSETEASRLFLQRIHRPLGSEDFDEGSPPSARTTMEVAIRRLCGHPLLQKLSGHPGRIRAASSKVVPGGPSLLLLAEELFPASGGGSPFLALTSGTQMPTLLATASFGISTTPSFGCPVETSSQATECGER